MKKIFFLFAILLFSPFIFANDSSWIAGTTSVSDLSLQEMKQMLDSNLDPHPEIQFEAIEDIVAVNSTSSWDWRNKDGKNWLTPIRSQGACGSCMAFSAVAAVESNWKISQGSANANIKLSPQFLFSCGGGSCTKGWYPDKAASFLMETGVTDEACMPYRGSGGSEVSCQKACANATDRTVKISSFTRPTTGVRNLEALRNALKKGPLVTIMSIYDDFRNYRRGIYKHKSGAYISGHAIVLVGYNDIERYLIIRNSWGTGWGESGYARISYDDVSGIGASTWKYEVPSKRVFAIPALDSQLTSLETNNELQPKIISQDSPDFILRELASDTAYENVQQFILENTRGFYEGPVQVYLKLAGGPKKVIGVEMKGDRVKITIKKDLLASGVWEIFASAGKESTSEPRTFYINQ